MSAESNRGLNAEQRAAVTALVGEEVALADECAVADAYADFRSGMESLRQIFDEKEVFNARQ